MLWLSVQSEVLRDDGQSGLHPSKNHHLTRHSGFLLNDILLWVFTGDALGISLVAKRKILAVFLPDFLHLLVSICLFSPVEESGRYRKSSHNHKDHNSDDTCRADISRHSGLDRCFMLCSPHLNFVFVSMEWT